MMVANTMHGVNMTIALTVTKYTSRTVLPMARVTVNGELLHDGPESKALGTALNMLGYPSKLVPYRHCGDKEAFLAAGNTIKITDEDAFDFSDFSDL